MNALTEVMRALEHAEIAYRTGAADETNEEMQNLMMQYAEERGDFLRALKESVAKNGLPVGPTDREEASELTGTEYDESDTLEAYERALEEDLPDDLRELIERQYDQIAEAHDHLLELRNLVSDMDTEGNSDTYDSSVVERDDTEPRDITPN